MYFLWMFRKIFPFLISLCKSDSKQFQICYVHEFTHIFEDEINIFIILGSKKA